MSIIHGTSENDDLAGTFADDAIYGLGGDDRISGLLGDDSLFGDEGDDVLNGGEGANSLYGGIGNDYLVAPPGSTNSVIDGGAGLDALSTLVSLLGTVITDVEVLLTNQGTVYGTVDQFEAFEVIRAYAINDTAHFSLNISGSGALDLSDKVGSVSVSVFAVSGGLSIISGSGSDQLFGTSLMDTFIGGAGDDSLHGDLGNDSLTGSDDDDFLDGGSGNDTMLGGSGDDFFVVDSRLDRVFETTTTASTIDAGGIDTVESAITFSLDGSVGLRFVERLELSGMANINATGNALANLLTGNRGKNTLDGGLGYDTMLGGAGNDIYIVNSASDRVFETATTASTIDAGGTDTVQSSVTCNMNAYVGVRFIERLTLTGTADINGTGNALANILTGNAGNNLLAGGLGADTLIGGAGNDSFVFDTPKGGGNVDRVSDFSVVSDTVRLDDAVFVGLLTGRLAASAFAANSMGQATDSLDRVVYETDSGRLFFDADGTGTGARVHFATLSANLELSRSDFIVF